MRENYNKYFPYIANFLAQENYCQWENNVRSKGTRSLMDKENLTKNDEIRHLLQCFDWKDQVFSQGRQFCPKQAFDGIYPIRKPGGAGWE